MEAGHNQYHTIVACKAIDYVMCQNNIINVHKFPSLISLLVHISLSNYLVTTCECVVPAFLSTAEVCSIPKIYCNSDVCVCVCLRSSEEECEIIHMGNAIMSFYSALIDLLGRCAPEMHVRFSTTS